MAGWSDRKKHDPNLGKPCGVSHCFCMMPVVQLISLLCLCAHCCCVNIIHQNIQVGFYSLTQECSSIKSLQSYEGQMRVNNLHKSISSKITSSPQQLDPNHIRRKACCLGFCLSQSQLGGNKQETPQRQKHIYRFRV